MQPASHLLGMILPKLRKRGQGELQADAFHIIAAACGLAGICANDMALHCQAAMKEFSTGGHTPLQQKAEHCSNEVNSRSYACFRGDGVLYLYKADARSLCRYAAWHVMDQPHRKHPWLFARCCCCVAGGACAKQHCQCSTASPRRVNTFTVLAHHQGGHKGMAKGPSPTNAPHPNFTHRYLYVTVAALMLPSCNTIHVPHPHS
jgi:hypothetical protein